MSHWYTHSHSDFKFIVKRLSKFKNIFLLSKCSIHCNTWNTELMQKKKTENRTELILIEIENNNRMYNTFAVKTLHKPICFLNECDPITTFEWFCYWIKRRACIYIWKHCLLFYWIHWNVDVFLLSKVTRTKLIASNSWAKSSYKRLI